MANEDTSQECRRIPRRSRFGCRNCKLRKLKCDEERPNCRKCLSFGISCNFMLNVPDLQPIVMNTDMPMTRRKTSLRPAISSSVWTYDKHTCYELNSRCQDFISRYLERSLVPPYDPNMVHVNRKLLGLAFAYPCLMHASLAVAYSYDRYLNKPKNFNRSLEECYHWSQSTEYFNQRLREPIGAKDRDPIWGTAAALAILSFSSPDAKKPEESWPLKVSKEADLNWLRMSKGKNSLWNMVNPLREDSIFNIMTEAFTQMFSPLPEMGTEGIPGNLIDICQLDDSSTVESNPYFCAAHAVSRLLDIPDDEMSTGNTQIFTMSLHAAFEELLRRRDPVALLLLYLWYCKAGRSIWWIGLRARVESPSICAYLQIYHKDNSQIQAVLTGGGSAKT
ncbi:uncharacterized protein N7469_011250 [Penicillium citrinum]|uniref:Zn(2)-C6 fungal-type domain-containing protein n=1 Tax=Penicillium citrinum TaxID=5077 RepID=A0A9W9TDL1_PENCI|nr:uncharacterized protein N7469_011250 [Penicillium citrinum]KAJ5217625.1 hypothetical protein N7469_011250 [Penicillium citrinum]